MKYFFVTTLNETWESEDINEMKIEGRIKEYQILQGKGKRKTWEFIRLN